MVEPLEQNYRRCRALAGVTVGRAPVAGLLLQAAWRLTRSVFLGFGVPGLRRPALASCRRFTHEMEEFRCLALRYDRPEVLVGTVQVGGGGNGGGGPGRLSSA